MRPLSVWPTGQHDHATQLRDSSCVPGTDTDPDRIPPAIAAHAVTTYTGPGDLVLDPDCGTGTVLTEALRAGRHTLGLTTDPHWWTIARANITAAKHDGACHDGSVLDVEPRDLATACAAGLAGRVALVLISLRVAAGPGPGRDLAVAANGLATTLHYCRPLLRPGGHVVIVARPRRHSDGTLVDVTTLLISAGARAGLAAVDRCVALTAELRGDRLITHATFTERRAARSCSAGTPVALTAHHEVLVFQRAADSEPASAAFDRPPPKAPATPAVSDRVGRRAA